MKPRATLLALLTIFAILLSSCAKATPTASVDPLTADLSEVEGKVNFKNPGETDFSPVTNGLKINVEGQITTGEDGRVRLDLSTGTIIRLASNTLFTLVSNEPEEGGLLTRIKIEAGRLWVALKGGSVDVDTPNGLASVRGSNLMIWVDPVTQNVYASCFEGSCSAGNSSGSTDFYTGSGVVLYHVETGSNPPPPGFYQLTLQDFQEWAQNNPEVQSILPDILSTLTAVPTFTPSPTFTETPTLTHTPTLSPTSAPTATEPSCSSLSGPSNGSEIPATGKVIFSWTSLSTAGSYELFIVSAGGATNSFRTFETIHSRFMESLPVGGTYSWYVNALDPTGNVLCASETFTFSKAAAPTSTPQPTDTPIPPLEPAKSSTPTDTPTPDSDPTPDLTGTGVVIPDPDPTPDLTGTVIEQNPDPTPDLTGTYLAGGENPPPAGQYNDPVKERLL